MNASTASARTELSGEDWARADFYALLGSLFFSPPKGDLLANIAGSAVMTDGLDTELAQAWSSLIQCAANTNEQTAREEYDSLFIGVGKPDLLMFGSFYQAGFLNEKPLVALREDLAAMGLGRRSDTAETEDHLAFLCEVMRSLIVESNPPKPYSQQREFFSRHLASWVFDFLDDLQAHPGARFYAATGRLARAFFDVERLSFDFEA